MVALPHPAVIVPSRLPAEDDELRDIWKRLADAAEAYRASKTKATGTELALAFGAYIAALPDREVRRAG